ncbi:MAG: alpha-galactosidase [Acidobacteria bacterium]|nr:alpha-galactosidase [Acidobacteriota bacterium]
MKIDLRLLAITSLLTLSPCMRAQGGRQPVRLQNRDLVVEANQEDGSYIIGFMGDGGSSLSARPAAKINGSWIFSTQYPKHTAASSEIADSLGQSSQILLTNSGLGDQPDLICSLRLHSNPSYVEMEVDVRNTTGRDFNVQSIRMVDSRHPKIAGVHEPAARVLSDSWSEDRPAMRIHDLNEIGGGMDRAVGSQLIYNRESKTAFFAGALTSDKWITVLRLHVDTKQARSTGYEIDSTGTTELTQENSLANSPPQDRVELALPLRAGESLSSERVMISFGRDYHALLETYGNLIRHLHQARTTAATPIGWWSWTAYYFGLNQDTALSNAIFLSEHLKWKGYDFFHIDEGYQYARGEYVTADARKYPAGMGNLENKIERLGLHPGIWTAPFEVSERSWVYQHAKDWLVHNAEGEPIHAGYVTKDPNTKQPLDPLFVLDSTHPEAQQYLRQTYITLAKDWGMHYIKLDFMEDSAIEGFYHKPNTTALEAQRMGLQVIREAVGNDVLLDKDGSPMLNPVGLVDCGRISLDTGHTFAASRDAATGIAARYYMNRNFFVSDPDAFTVSRQTVVDEQWHGGNRPLSFDEAKVSIALAAVSGGMYEIGDDLPTLFLDRDRMALVENDDLLNMARLGRASKPLDLMTYLPEDELPSIYVLQESKRQSMVTLFNWTESARRHRIALNDLGADISAGRNQVLDVLEGGAPVAENTATLDLQLPPHSVRMLKIVNTAVRAAAPTITVHTLEHAEVGTPVEFSALVDDQGVPAVTYTWDFGDGTTARGASVSHTFTHDGSFSVHLRGDGIEGLAFEKKLSVAVSGRIGTRFHPDEFQRHAPER